METTLDKYASYVKVSETGRNWHMKYESIFNFFEDSAVVLAFGQNKQKQDEMKTGYVFLAIGWQVDLKGLPILGDLLYGQHWISGCKEMDREIRQYQDFLVENEKGETCFRGRMTSTLVNMNTFKKEKTEYQNYAHLMEDGAPQMPPMALDELPVEIQVPEEGKFMAPFTVKRDDLDMVNHVNNSKYIGMASEYIPEDFPVGRIRVQYKYSARYHDVIYPKVTAEADRYTVSLCSKMNKPYAIVQFIKGDFIK